MKRNQYPPSFYEPIIEKTRSIIIQSNTIINNIVQSQPSQRSTFFLFWRKKNWNNWIISKQGPKSSLYSTLESPSLTRSDELITFLIRHNSRLGNNDKLRFSMQKKEERRIFYPFWVVLSCRCANNRSIRYFYLQNLLKQPYTFIKNIQLFGPNIWFNLYEFTPPFRVKF